MSVLTYKIYTGVLQVSILSLTWALVWFAFIYYPKVINNYKAGYIPHQPIIKTTNAQYDKFPIEATTYRLVFDQGSQTYYAFIEGGNLNQYLLNKNSAELTLKTALSVENLCNINIIYASAQNLKIPKDYQSTTNCQ